MVSHDQQDIFELRMLTGNNIFYENYGFYKTKNEARWKALDLLASNKITVRKFYVRASSLNNTSF
jgi:hypothetical protein